MARAYRSDVIGKQNFEGAIRQLRDASKPERVQCPVASCECTYEMYGYTPLDRERNVATLQERLKGEHPNHTSEVLAVNAFRKFPRC
jgi:hypothetical protein